MRRIPFFSLAMVFILTGCGVHGRIDSLAGSGATVTLGLPYEDTSMHEMPSVVAGDTLEVEDMRSGETIIMKAVRDEDGEMVATDVINAAMVTARFRNVAERHGKVDLRFRISVPQSMQDSKWQLRFYPDMYMLGDTVSLEPVIITGLGYRKAQLRGYEQYQKFLDSIISDESLLVNVNQLEIFLKRNLPQLYAFKSDSTFVNDELFYSYYGVTEQEAVVHYTNRFKVWNNDRKKSLVGKKYEKYVKVPITTEGIRLDTVLRAVNGDFVYEYVQTVNARPGLKKAEISLDGDIYEEDKRIYSIPDSPSLTFYISSLSTLVDATEKYITTVIERSVEANTACYIDFSAGRSDVDRTLGDNASEIGRIEANLHSLAFNEDLSLDSIVVTASASPEGSFQSNSMLSSRRSASVASYFKRYMHSLSDSLQRQSHYTIGMEEDDFSRKIPEIDFISRSNPENWRMLDAIVRSDEVLSDSDKGKYYEISLEADPDARERRLQSQPFYKYFRQVLYPRLRTVCFDFYLHRRGMEKDTVHTTVLDTAYMRGVQAIRDRDYATAVTILRPYRDYNTAIAYCSMDYNASALDILKDLDKTPQVNYMMSLINARRGNYSAAVSLYLESCRQDKSYIHRGNLDPEISELIRKYGLDVMSDQTDSTEP